VTIPIRRVYEKRHAHSRSQDVAIEAKHTLVDRKLTITLAADTDLSTRERLAISIR
jgi:hypothetical protein